MTVDIKEIGNRLADWFCLSWGCGQAVEQVGSHIKDWQALEHLLPNSLMWLLAHLGSSLSVGLRLQFLCLSPLHKMAYSMTVWFSKSKRWDRDRVRRDRDREMEKENSRGKSQPFITYRSDIPSLLPYAIGHRDHPGAVWRDYARMEISGSGDPRGHLGGWLSQMA